MNNHLSKQEQIELFNEYKATNNIVLRNKLITTNLRFIIATAKKFSNNNFEKEELINTAVLAFIHAIDMFDPNKQASLITYAYPWMCSSLRQYIIKNEQAVSKQDTKHARIYNRYKGDVFKIESVADSDEKELFIADLAQKSNTKIKHVEKYLDSRKQRMFSLDQPISEDSNYYDVMSDEKVISSEEYLIQKTNDEERATQINSLNQAIKELPVVWQDTLLLGVVNSAKKYNISNQRASQIKQKAIKRLNRNLSFKATIKYKKENSIIKQKTNKVSIPKLSDQEMDNIKQSLQKGASYKEISIQYNVSYKYLYGRLKQLNIKRKKKKEIKQKSKPKFKLIIKSKVA